MERLDGLLYMSQHLSGVEGVGRASLLRSATSCIGTLYRIQYINLFCNYANAHDRDR